MLYVSKQWTGLYIQSTLDKNNCPVLAKKLLVCEVAVQQLVQNIGQKIGTSKTVAVNKGLLLSEFDCSTKDDGFQPQKR